MNPFYMFGKTFGHSVNFRYRSITFFRFFFNFQVSKINLGKISQKERMDLPAISLREIGFQKNDDVALSFVFQPVVSRTIVAKIFMRRKYIKIIINECCTWKGYLFKFIFLHLESIFLLQLWSCLYSVYAWNNELCTQFPKDRKHT